MNPGQPGTPDSGESEDSTPNKLEKQRHDKDKKKRCEVTTAKVDSEIRTTKDRKIELQDSTVHEQLEQQKNGAMVVLPFLLDCRLSLGSLLMRSKSNNYTKAR